jgi:threonine dehydratase
MSQVPTADQIVAARASIDPVFLNSPLMGHPALDEALGCRCTLKVETLNPVRSFKGRGTEALMAALRPRPGAVVASSAGNFGQGLVRAAVRRDVAATIFCAAAANPVKVAAMRRLGATVTLVPGDEEDAKTAARESAAKTGALFVEDGAHIEIAAGAGTMAQEMTEAGLRPDVLVVPIGDGALAIGVGAWMKAASPQTRIVGVVAEGAPCMAESFRLGRPVATERADTIADGISIRAPIPSAVQGLRAVVDEIVLVDDATILRAVRLLAGAAGILAEPAGAAGTAALLAYQERFRGAAVATIITGSHLDPALLAAGA